MSHTAPCNWLPYPLIFRPSPPSKTRCLWWRARFCCHCCCLPMAIPSPLPRPLHFPPTRPWCGVTSSSPPFPSAPPWFRAPLILPGNANVLLADCVPQWGSAPKFPPAASTSARHRGFCTGASTRIPCTGAGLFVILRRGWGGRSLKWFIARYSCVTDQPADRIFQQTYL